VSTTRKSAPIDTIPNLKNRRLTNGSAVRETGASLSSCPADYARRVHSCTICGWPPFITACTSAAPSGAGFRAAGTSTVGAVRGRSLAAWRCPLAPRACRACHRRGASRRRAHGSVGYGGRLLPQLLAANSSVTPPRDTVLPRRVGGGAWLGTPVPRSCQTRPASGTDIGARRVRGERASSVGPLVHQSIHADRAWRRAARSEQSKQRRCAHAWGVLAPARRRGRSCAHVLARTLDVRAVRALGVFGAF
jgi:hypothetical protein